MTKIFISRSLFLALFLTNCLFLQAGLKKESLPEPYSHITVRPYQDEPNFYRNGKYLKLLIKKHKIKTVIEVGSFLGKSTIHIASLLKGKSKVYAVDHWQGSLEHQPGNPIYEKLKDLMPVLYEQFLSNVIHKELANKIVPIRMGSLEAAKTLTYVNPDLVYLDASHDTDSVYKDIQAWYPYVKEEGILCGDDWSWGSVRDAVQAFASENGLKIDAIDNFWMLSSSFD